MDSEVALFSAWVFMGFIGCLIGSFKDRKGSGLVLGLCLGPVGWILILFDAGPKTAFAVFVLMTIYASVLIEKHSSEDSSPTKDIEKTALELPSQIPSALPPEKSPTTTPNPRAVDNDDGHTFSTPGPWTDFHH